MVICYILGIYYSVFILFAAYTMAKYGMSMCVLGMAEEFKSDGIAVNALWPKTGKKAQIGTSVFFGYNVI